MKEEEIGTEGIYLMSETETAEAGKLVAIRPLAEMTTASKNTEKFVFTVFYALADKEVILSELKKMGAVIVNHSDKDSAVTAKMSMEQLAAIKTLDGVERVEVAKTVKQSKKSVTNEETYDMLNTQQNYATNKTLYWETSDSSVATVDQSGVVTARGAGTACIRAYSQDGSNKSSCCEIWVDVPVKSVTINTTSLLMRVGEQEDLNAEICPTDAVNQLTRWTSTDTSVVWVNEATGQVEARGVGNATVYATAQDGTGVRGSCAIQVEVPLTDEQLSEQIIFCLSLLTEYSNYAYILPMQYAVLKNLDSEEAAIAEQTELLQSIQLVNYILLENKLVANSPTASNT